jgi:hypothetical protein
MPQPAKALSGTQAQLPATPLSAKDSDLARSFAWSSMLYLLTALANHFTTT